LNERASEAFDVKRLRHARCDAGGLCNPAIGVVGVEEHVSKVEEHVSKLYSEPHRELQDRFDTRRLADLLEKVIVHSEFVAEDKDFIESRDMFFLSTIDPAGRPTVSYKGGTPGFVQVAGPSTLLFPCYDGNGMYYSMGNLMVAAEVGLLFIDFETPNRLRVQGKAEICFDHPRLAQFAGAEFLVSITAEQIWVNCARYIHRYQKLGTSKYVPKANSETPFAVWKRVGIVQDVLPAKDQGKAETAGGEITEQTYLDLLKRGET
jgi:predicted pyridoxine 5'-phosphate oxidase superfamily flavin-nucleotide-binding protein